MRSTHELLELMLENKHLFKGGLCNWVLRLYLHDKINEEEMELLKALIAKDKPKRTLNGFYWMEHDIEPRLEWINNKLK